LGRDELGQGHPHPHDVGPGFGDHRIGRTQGLDDGPVEVIDQGLQFGRVDPLVGGVVFMPDQDPLQTVSLPFTFLF
jgi:hypothetical protein